MPTTQLLFLPERPAAPPSPPPPAKPPPVSEKNVHSPPLREEASLDGVGRYVNLKAWGVRDAAGAWVMVPNSQWRAEHEAKHLTRTEALAVFEGHTEAYQLVSGCDVWACLSDEPEVFVVKKEKKDVPAAKAVHGAGGDLDGSGTAAADGDSASGDAPEDGDAG